MTNNLSRSEATARARIVTDASYDVGLDLTTGPEWFLSTTHMRFNAVPGETTFADLVATQVHSVELNGVRLDDAFDGARIALPDLAEHNELVVVAQCAYSATSEGLHRFVDPVDDRVYTYTQFEPFEAHRVFACFDQPDLKASWTVTVRCPADWVVVGTTQGHRSTDEGDGDATWTFPASAPISTYLYAVAAGDYVSVHSEHDGIPLGLYCRASLFEHLDAETVFDLTRRGFDHFRPLFAQPYTFGKYDQVFVPELTAGAMENVACVTLSESMLFRSQVTRTLAMRRAEVILHELAHMWFGNLVTMRWWDDLWLNESFATFASVHALVHATEFTEAWTYFCDVAKTMAREQDQLPSTHPVIADAIDIETATANFDGITYAKGASVLRQLVAWVGEDAFFAGLRGYFAEHAWENTDFADLLRHLERSSGRSLTAWSESWLHTTGVNTIRAVAGDRGVTLQQLGEPLRNHRLALGLYLLGQGRLRRTERVEVDLINAEQLVNGFPMPGDERLLLVNDDDLTYAKVRLDDQSWQVLLHHIDQLDDSLARSVCWGAAWDTTRDAEVPAGDYLELVMRGIVGETDHGVVERLLVQARVAVLDLGAPELSAERLITLSRFCLEQARRAPAGSDRQRAFTTTFVISSRSPEQLKALLAVEETVPGLAVDTEFRWTVMRRLAELGAATADSLAAEVAQHDDTADGRLQHQACLAARPDADAKAAAWARIVDEDDLTHAERMALISGFNLPEQGDLVAPYAQRFYDDLPTLWARRAPASATVPLQVRALFPAWDVSTEALDRADAVLAGQLPASLRRVVEDCRANLERNMRCRALEQPVPAGAAT